MNLKILQATSKGYIEVKPYGAFDWSYPAASHGAEGCRVTTVTYHPQSCAKTKYMCMKKSKIIVYDDYNNKIPNNQDVIGCVRPMFSRNALRASWKIIEVYE